MPSPKQATSPEAQASAEAEAIQDTTLDTFIPWTEPFPFHPISSTLTSPSPYYNPSHHLLRRTIRAYTNTHILPHQHIWEANGKAGRAAALAYAKSGIPFADVPPPYRPRGFEKVAGVVKWEECNAFHWLVATDEMYRVFTGVACAIGGATGIGAPPIINHGTEEQKRRWLPGLFSWETSFCLGITEPTGGSDVSNIRTTAEKTPDGHHYVVNGFKKWITGAPNATHMTTAVRTSGPSTTGLSLLIIPLSTTGITIRRIPNSGQAAGGASAITLSNVLVPADHLLGREGHGFAYIATNFNKERMSLAVGCNRMARTCLDTALSYALERETFGAVLASRQLIRQKLTEMARRIESHWAWLESIVYAVQQSEQGWQAPEIAGRIAMAKVAGGRLLELSCREAQQVLGGNGYVRGEGVGGRVEQISRDLRMMVVGGGSEEIMGELAFKEEMKNARKAGAGRGDAAKL